MASKREQKVLARAFNSTGAATKATPVGVPGDLTSFTNFLQARDVRGLDSVAVWIETPAGGTSATATIQVTADPAGNSGWTNAAYRVPGGGAYATTALTITPSFGQSYFLDPADGIAWIRISITANTGPVVITAYVMGNI